RAAIDLSYLLLALPVALLLVPWPEPHLWPVLAGAMGIHIAYKVAQAKTYQRGAFTVVYPVVRGSAPLVVVLVAMVVFDERFNAVQWVGLGLLVGGIFGLALNSLRKLQVGRDTLVPALAWALITGVTVAAYT
ncbi:EamA family transporter, partial [Escherichia coli]|uniref:EamA family transporter n=1 Tax=Escherichia coli TaxID=562 RepID=UPI003D9E7270